MLDESNQANPPSFQSEPDMEYDPLLYWGGAGANVRDLRALFSRGGLGAPNLIRGALVKKIREVIDTRLSAGGSRRFAKSTFQKIRTFYSWADQNGINLTLENVANSFLKWTDYLDSRQRSGAIKGSTAYNSAGKVGSVLDEVLEPEVSLLRQTRLRRRDRHSKPNGADVSIDLEQAFILGRTLCDIVNALSVEAIRGPLPILIQFRAGVTLKHWSGLRDVDTVKSLKGSNLWERRKVSEARRMWEEDTSLRTRWSVVNLRIQAEMLIFIAQTGMNPSQVWALTTGQFSYRSHLNGYQVRRVYKARRQGEVVFEIYTEYRPFFERYLVWRNEFFPKNDEAPLFPLIGWAQRSQRTEMVEEPCRAFRAIRNVCTKLSVQFITPSLLRKVRINWLARRSGDLDQTAEMAQHSRQVLIRNYLKTDPNIAAVEITRFYQKTDPAFSPPGPGICIQPSAVPLSSTPPNAPQPDCVSSAGCLFCSHQRDIDSFDHVWSLITYKHLKTIELATYRAPALGTVVHPASTVIDRVSEKIGVYVESNLKRHWVDEAIERVREGDYHPLWSGFIELAEVLI